MQHILETVLYYRGHREHHIAKADGKLQSEALRYDQARGQAGYPQG